MKREIGEIKQEVQSKLRYNQALLLISMILGTFFFLTTNNLYLTLLFISIGALSLPNINNSKSDLDKLFKHEFSELTLKVMDVFPEKVKRTNSRWVVFAYDIDDKKETMHEIVISIDDIKIDDIIRITRTPKLKILIEITKGN